MNTYPNLKALRMEHSYKQEYVADILGITQPEYSKLESGLRKIDARIIKELCKLYDVTADVLLRQHPSIQQMAAASDPKQFPANNFPGDVLHKILDNYNSILENFSRQQQVNEKIIDQLMKDKNKEEDEDKLKN
jgi:transcriptional regulator with XRE-family HTH domain